MLVLSTAAPLAEADEEACRVVALEHSDIPGTRAASPDAVLVPHRRRPRQVDELAAADVFSPDGRKILFMSAAPYAADPSASKILSIKTDFMLMDADGSHLQRLTHFAEPGYAEHAEQRGIAASGDWAPDGRSLTLLELVFPLYRYWRVEFAGACGKAPR